MCEHTRLDNYCRAHIAERRNPVLCLLLDAVPMAGIVRLVKIDAEGHDLQVLLAGVLESPLQRDWPRLIVEDSPGGTVARRLTERGYAIRASAGNILGQPDDVVSGA